MTTADNGPLVYQFTVHSVDEELRAIEVLAQALAMIPLEARMRVIQFVEDKVRAEELERDEQESKMKP